MDQSEAEAWARDWVESWNSHDLNRILGHFTEDAVFSSPVVPVVTGKDNPLCGRAELEAYWSEGLRRLPTLHFTLKSVYRGSGSIGISYSNQRGQDCLEVLELDDDGLARRGTALYRPVDSGDG